LQIKILKIEPVISSVKVKENSWIAIFAARKLRVKSVAIVFGNTIHLCNATRDDLLNNERWLKHELCHIQQYKKHGRYLFIFKYLWQNFRHGYYNNPYEIEARAAEFL